MELPSAIREDHNPFALLGFFPGLQRFLIFARWTSYKCPHCNSVFRRDYWTNNVRLGSGERECEQCGIRFDDGSREWPELSIFRRVRFFFPPLAIGIWGGFTVAAIASLYIGPRDEHSWPVVFVVSAFGLMPILAFSPVQLTRAIRSVRRYNERGEIHSA
jgi:hypothetical protein